MKKLFSTRTIILAGSLLLQLSPLCFQSRGAAGDVDLSFDPGLGVNGPVNAVAVQADGKVIIGGRFTTIRGFARTNLARLNADGSGDPTFNPGKMFDAVDSLALQPDGRVLVGSQFVYTECYEDWGCENYYGSILTRLHPNGIADASFSNATVNAGSPYGFTVLTLQPDGKILAGGYFSGANGTNRNGIVRLNANGTLDASFNPGTGIGGHQPWVFAIAVQSDGKLIVGGIFDTFNGISRNGIVRLNPDGSVDGGFNPGTGLSGEDSRVASISLQPDGKILVGGYFTSANSSCIARFNTNGTPDNSFNPGSGAAGIVSALAVQPDGGVILGGSFNAVNGTNRNRIARLNADGSLDNSFNPGTGIDAGVGSLVLHSNGKVIVGGTFTTVNGTNRLRVARLNSDGSLDGSFDPGQGLERAVSALALQPDGKVLIGGALTFINGTNRYGRDRLNLDGSVDSSFVSSSFNPDLAALIPTEDCPPGFPDPCVTITVPECSLVQTNGKVLVGGYVLGRESYFDGDVTYYRYFIARFHADGSRDTSFEPAVGDRRYWETETVRALAVQPDGKVVIGGIFYSIKGTNRPGIARLNANGSLDHSFVPGTGAVGLNAIAVQPDGKVLLGSYYSSWNGTNVMRLNADGSLDSSFKANTGAYGVNAIVVQPDGRVLIAGGFQLVNGTNRNRIARLDSDGSLDLGFDPGIGADGIVRCLAVQPDGNILIGGDFTTVNGVVHPYVARLHGDSVAPSLHIARSNGLAIVSWPATGLNFQLQENTDLSISNSWSPVAQPAVTNAGRISTTVPASVGRKFFRLNLQ